MIHRFWKIACRNAKTQEVSQFELDFANNCLFNGGKSILISAALTLDMSIK